jgi:nucleoid-associated protein YgaU
MIKNDLPLSKANFEQLNIILPPKEEVEITYKIRSGESLSTIAYSIYGDFRKWEIIYNANRDKIENPSLVVAGTDIRIPILKK